MNLTHLTASQDDIRLTAEGKIILGEVHAGTDIRINSKAIETTPQSHVQAGQHLTLTTDTLHNQGQIRAGGDITLKATKLDNVNPTGQSHPVITAGKNNRITADEINNVGELSAAQNLTLTGNNFSTQAIKDRQGNSLSKLSAGGDLTATLKQAFRFDVDKDPVNAGKKPTVPALITGKNIALTANDLVNSASMQAEQNITVNAETVYLGHGHLTAGHQVMLEGKSHLDVKGYDISGRNVTLLASRGLLSVVSGDDNTPAGMPAFTTLSADNRLRIIAEGHINLSNILINKAKNIFLAANEMIEMAAYADFDDEGIRLNEETKQALINRLHTLSHLTADENIEVHAGKVIDLRTLSLTAGNDITLTSGDALDISTEDAYEYENGDKKYTVDEGDIDDEEDDPSAPSFQFPIIKSTLTAGRHLTLNAGGQIVDTDATLRVKGTTAITQHNTELHSAEGRYNSVAGQYTPVTTALINRALSGAPQLTLNLAEVEGEVPGLQLADKQTRITAKNNRPIIHIAAPNTRGVSHNRYQAFNIGTSGLVLNNATHETPSLLAGRISANLNFTGQPAALIINEVVGSLSSTLQGQLEVVGQAAPVVIANPNGITCNGCRFTQTPAVTLSTGKPGLDKDGALAALTVKTGFITLSEAGWDATAQDKIEIISRTTQLHGPLRAKNLTLIQGPNQVDVKHGTLIPLTAEGYTPGKAIDTGSLGGMSAHKIRLVSTEPGKTVNLTNLTATQGDINMTAEGQVILGAVQAKTDINLRSQRIEMAEQSQMQAGQHLILTTETLQNQGRIRAGGDVTIKAKTLSSGGGNVNAGNHVLLQGENRFTVQGTDISGHDVTLIANSGGISVSSGGNSAAEGVPVLPTISAANTLRILSRQGISLSQTLINRAKNIFLAGNGQVDIHPHLAVDENIELHAGAGINLHGIALTAGKDITLTSGDSMDIDKVMAGNKLTLIAGWDITESKATWSAEGAVAIAKNSPALHLAKGRYTPVTSALIDLALGHVSPLTITLPEIAGGLPGLTLADKQTRISLKNNRPIIHIAAPNARGISHNRYQAFNVGSSGVVLNNATAETASVLAGPIQANPHFTGQSAELIIHEVVGTLASTLQGLLEVAGQKAAVFIANPNGITCNGCGFIQTPAITLSTGQPVWDKNGALAALDVKKGTLTIGKKGLTATAQDVDIFSRTTELHGPLRAKNLTLTQGPNRMDIKRGALTPLTWEGDTRWKAIDTGSLGSMLADKIRLVSTEPGRKVNLTHLTATQGDLQVTADGEVTLGNVQAKTDITVSSQAIKTAEQSDVQAGNDITLATNTLDNWGQMVAGGDMRLFVDRLHNWRHARLQAHQHLWLQKDASGHLSTRIDNDSAALQTRQGDIVIRTKALSHSGGANLSAGANAYINATRFDNSGQVNAQNTLIVTGHDFNGTEGTLSAALNVVADFMHRFSGSAFISAKNILLHADDITSRGHFEAENDLTVIAEGKIELNKSRLAAQKNLTLMAGHGITAYDAELTGENVALLAREGDIQMRGDGASISANHQVQMVAGNKLDLQGTLAAQKNLTLMAGHDIAIAQAGLTGENIELLARNGNIRMGSGGVSISADNRVQMIAGNNLYLQGTLAAKKNLTLTAGKDITAYDAGLTGENVELLAREGDIQMRGDGVSLSANHRVQMVAGNALDLYGIVLDKADNITLNAGHKINADRATLTAKKNLTLTAGHGITARQTALTGENVELLARNGDIHMAMGALRSRISASHQVHLFASHKLDLQDLLLDKVDNMTLNAGHEINARQVKWAAKNNLTLIAGHAITADHAGLTGENVELLVREGDIRMGRDQPYSWSGLSANNHLRISAGHDLDLYGTRFNQSRHLTVSAGRNLNASQSQLNAAGNIHLFAGNDLMLRRARLNAGQQVTLSAGHDIDMSRPPTSESRWRVADLAGSITHITAGDDLQLSAGGDIVGRMARLTSTQGSVLVNAGGDFIFSAQKYSPVNDEDQHYLYATGAINAARNLTLTAAGNLLTYGTNLTSGSDMRLSAGGNVRFESLPEFIREGNSGRFTQHASQLKSGGALTLHARGSMLFQATALIAQGVMDITATGGFLYAQAMEEVYRWEEEKRSCKRVLGIQSCKVFGSKTETRRKERSTHKVTELTAGGDITLRAKDDVTLEASRIDTQKNAKITSQTGKVNFRAMPNTAVEQTLTTSTGFFITQHDKGHSEKRWIIPSVQVGGTLTVEAADGISADVKVKAGQLLEDALGELGHTPGTEWLNNLQDRNDVQWNIVKDAYSRWDQKSTRLNPVAGAVMAIAVAAVTAGSGLAAWAGSGAVGATGATGATASAVYGAAYGGMIGLASQAAVALIENKGNLTQTLSTLAQRDSVKSLVTQITVGGALGGLDHTMGWGKLVEGKTVVDPLKVQLPLLSQNNWSQVAQRVAAQSVVSSTLGTAIHGGSLTDNLQTALLSNIGSQINAEGAGLIGDNGEILGVPGKAISHAAVSALAAEIGGGNAKGAAVGALAAELAAITLDKTFSDPMNIQAGGKIIGGVAGAIATNSAAGANSGANAGEIVVENNFLSVNELDSFAHQARTCEGESCKQVIKDMVETNIRNQQ
ncbi:DUF637 domain-containing protein, partial [Photorhabdus tasmaniensis]|uniref:two-partner secretion domain-containing protein n=1 Tax=Photorhabdus tasmaniensis TaxID=1004159 RepID=UPI0030ED4639